MYKADENQPLGYKARFGYSSCNSDVSQGGMWINDTNPRRCICARKDEDNKNRPWLPFSTENYFADNADDTNNYTHIGFNQGAYGETVDCTDAEGSYYGYRSCYIGSYSKDDASKGMCLKSKDNDSSYNYIIPDYDCRETLNNTLTDNGAQAIPYSFSLKPEESHCINMYHHCLSPSGQRLGDENVCALVVPGCNQGIEDACNTCYATANLIYDGTKYTLNPNFLLRLYIYGNNTAMTAKMERCPDGYIKSNNFCVHYCGLNNLSECKKSYILTADGTSSSQKIGIVLFRTNKNLTIVAIKNNTSMTWDDAMAYAASYYPGIQDGNNTYQNHPTIGSGNWYLPQPSGYPASNYLYMLDRTVIPVSGGGNLEVSGWTGKDNGDQAYHFMMWYSTNYLSPKTNKKSFILLTKLDI